MTNVDATVADVVDTPEEVVWRRLVRYTARVSARLDRELGERHGIHSSELEVLAAVAKAAQPTMTDVCAAAAISASGGTRVVHHLVTLGLLSRRREADGDRRLYRLALTEAGRDCLEDGLRSRRDVLGAEAYLREVVPPPVERNLAVAGTT